MKTTSIIFSGMRKLFFFMVMSFTVASVWGQSPGFTVGGRICAPEQGCGGDSTRFTAAGAGVTAWLWNFGDAAALPVANTSTLKNPRHFYATAGSYTVSMRASRPGLPDTTVIQTVTINALPQAFEFFGGKEDTTICPGTKLILDPYLGQNAPADVKYLWYPRGDSTRTLTVDSLGCYSVEVKNAAGCTVTDRINVKVCTQQEQQASKWYFGNNAGISFQGGSPSVDNNGKINTPEGTSSISNRRGELLFYTDGITIFDKNGNPMTARNPADTARLLGSPTSTQSVLIVPQPSCRGCETLYYVFTTTNINDTTKCLSYSLVDMRGNRGRGLILERNVPVYCGSTERITSVQNPTDSTYWVVTHDFGTNTFRLFNLTPNGLQAAGTQSIGLPHDTKFRGEGQIKLSNDGRKLAVVVPGPPRNFVEIYDFNDSTGVISNKVTLDLGPAPPSAYGVEFSPDGTKVYITLTGNPDSSRNSELIQFDITSTDSTIIATSKIIVQSSPQKFGALQFAPDGRIYMAIQGSTSLGRINNPDGRTLAEIDFQENGFNLGGRTSQLGLPNFVTSNIEPPTGPGIVYSDTCFGTPTQFQSGPICDPLEDKYEWEFGDGSRSTMQTAVHTYKAPGTYTVRLRQYNQCKDTVMTQRLTIKPSPVANLGPDITACRRSVTLDTKNTAPQSQYLWLRNGRPISQTGPRISVSQSGTYTVLVAIDECLAADTITVNLTPPPPFSLGPDTALCRSASLVLDTRVGTAFLWNTGATTQRITASQPGLYSVDVTQQRNNQECVSSDTVEVFRGTTPQLNTQIQNASGCTSPNGQIRATLQNPLPNTVYGFVWTRLGNNTPLPAQTSAAVTTLTNLRPGTYLLQVRGGGLCDSLFRFTVGTTPPPTLRITPTVSNASCRNLAAGGNISLVVALGTPTRFRLFNQSNTELRSGAFSTGLNGLNPGTYSMEFTDAEGCLATLSGLRVGVTPDLPLELGPTRGQCDGDTVNLTPLVAPQGTNYASTWNTGATTPSLIVRQSGQYILTITDRTQPLCRVADTVRVNFVPKPAISAGIPQNICANIGPTRLLGASPSGGVWTGTGVDSVGVFTPSFQIIGSQTLRYSINANGCIVSATKNVTVLRTPQVDLGPNRAYCANLPQQLSVVEISGARYFWSNGANTPSIRPTTSGTYSVTAVVDNCRASDTVQVTLLPVPTVAVRPTVSLCVIENATVVLDGGGNPSLNYFWNPTGDTTRRITVARPGVYSVRITNAEGCSEEAPIQVLNLCEPNVFVPEVFTPNGDGVNEGLQLFTEHILDEDFEFQVYNRWGELVYMTNSRNERWDGRYKGRDFPGQSYAWVMRFRSQFFPERGISQKRGAVIVGK